MDGTYRIQGVPSGTYKIIAEADGYVREYYDNSTFNPDLVTVTAPDEVANINFSLGHGGTITGRVIDQDTDQPLAFMSVNVNLNVSIYYPLNACTDDQGYYTITGVPLDVDFRVSSGSRLNTSGEYPNMLKLSAISGTPIK